MKPGPKPKGKVKIIWSPKFAYAIGLITADGCLVNDGRHIDFTSTDEYLVRVYIRCLEIKNKIAIKYSSSGNPAFYVRFSDVLFHQFLQSIDLHPVKSKTIQKVTVPKEYFRDFLRGLFDGDGSSYDYYVPIFKKSFRFYISFASASPAFMQWLLEEIRAVLPVTGYISRTSTSPYLQLKFSKNDSKTLADFMYWSRHEPYLKRKELKISRALRIMGKPLEW